MEKEILISQLLEQINLLKRYNGKKGNRAPKESIGFVLHYLYHQNKSIYPRDLCEELQISMPRVTALLNTMESKGLIIRTPSADDHRRICISLSEQGTEAVEEKHRNQHRMMDKLIDKIGEEDAITLLRILKSLLS